MIKPAAEIAPPTPPTMMATPGATTTSEAAPMMTPPASVAFNTTSISSFEWTRRAKAQAPMTLAVMERVVLTTTLYWDTAGASAELKLGQNMKRKTVPIIARVWELYPPTHF